MLPEGPGATLGDRVARSAAGGEAARKQGLGNPELGSKASHFAAAGLEFTAEVLEGQVEKPHELGMGPEIPPEGRLGDAQMFHRPTPIPAARVESGDDIDRCLLPRGWLSRGRRPGELRKDGQSLCDDRMRVASARYDAGPQSLR